MTTPPAGTFMRGPALTSGELTGIADVLRQSGEPVAGPLTATLIAGGRSNMTLRLDDGESRWVLRTPPPAGRTASAHDVGREYRVTAALEQTEVPVARAIVFHEDETLIGGPFAIAEFVEGRTVQTRAQLDALTDTTVEAVTDALIATLVALHRVNHVAAGLERFGRPDAYAARQLKRWAAQWQAVGTKIPEPLAGDVITRLDADVPDQPTTGIVHGDFRIDNTLLSLDTVSPHVEAVVDWELCTIGDPVADVAMMCAYRHPAFDLIVGKASAWTSPRFPTADQLAAAYEAASGVPLANWRFHLALAYFKIGVIAAGIDHRLRAGADSGPGFDTSGESVQTYLELALDTMRAAR